MENVFDIVLLIIYGLFSLGVLVFVHEMGHFIAGKLTGIRVTGFSIGFGRGIFSFDHKGTNYKLGWIPIGGYCRFAGEGEDLSDDRKGEPDEMYERPAWARLITVSAGAIFNFIFAIVIFSFISYFGYSYKSPGNKIVVLNKTLNSSGKQFPALAAGLKTGDRLISINGVKTPNFKKIVENVAYNPLKNLKIKVNRNGKIKTFNVLTAIRSDGSGYINITYDYPVIINNVIKGKPADKAGLKLGDEIISINNKKIVFYRHFKILLNKNKTSRAILTIKRKGKIRKIYIKPYQYKKSYMLGFMLKLPPGTKKYYTSKFGIFGSIGNGFVMFGDTIKKFVKGIKSLFNKEVDKTKAIAGPIRVVLISGTVLKQSSFSQYAIFLAYISIMLGIMNLLPIPAVDGGHVVLNVVEMIRRKRMSFKILQRIQMVGLAILVSLMVMVLYLDIVNLISK